MNVKATGLLCAVVLLASGCCKGLPGGDKDTDKGTDKPTTGTTPAGASDTATPRATSTAAPKSGNPGEGVYSMSNIKTIPDNCAKAHVLMATAPVTSQTNWAFTRQAVIAHPEFKAGSGRPPTAPGEVQFLEYAYGTDGKNKALVAHCQDGGTCNKLAAMYRAVVPSSRPQPACGEPYNLKGEGMPIMIPHPGVGNEDDMPVQGDLVSMCARIGVCKIHIDPSTPGDPGIECQKAPSKFKTACALKKPCSAVVECLGK